MRSAAGRLESGKAGGDGSWWGTGVRRGLAPCLLPGQRQVTPDPCFRSRIRLTGSLRHRRLFFVWQPSRGLKVTGETVKVRSVTLGASPRGNWRIFVVVGSWRHSDIVRRFEVEGSWQRKQMETWKLLSLALKISIDTWHKKNWKYQMGLILVMPHPIQSGRKREVHRGMHVCPRVGTPPKLARRAPLWVAP